MGCSKLLAVPPSIHGPGVAAVKLSEWHLLDITSLAFHYLDVASEKSLPVGEQRGWLYGWGFSYVFTRAAWELAPFPDVEFAEDAGFIEGLMARGVPVSLVGLDGSPQERGIVAHTLHPSSTTGAEFNGFKWNDVSLGMAVKTPKAFTELMPRFRQVRAVFQQASPIPGERNRWQRLKQVFPAIQMQQPSVAQKKPGV